MPKWGLAMTLTQGAGVRWSGVVVTTYSSPSGVKPPSPLPCSSPAGADAAGVSAVGGRGPVEITSGGTRLSGKARRFT
ncbi:hypothetical protein D3C87_1552690 [compost metagenome]